MPTPAFHDKARPVIPGARQSRLLGMILLGVFCAGHALDTPAVRDSRADSIPRRSDSGATIFRDSDMKIEVVTDSLNPDSAPVPQEKPIPALNPRLWQASSFDMYEIPDAALTAELWRMSGLAGKPEEGAYQVLLLSDSTPHAYLLRAGTQIGKLPDSTLPLLRQKVRSGALSRGGGTALWRNFWNPGDRLKPFLWQTGFEVDARQAFAVVRRANPLLEQHVNFTFAQRPEPWLHTEVGGHFSRHGGGLRRNILNPLDQDPNARYWGRVRPWWHAAVGVPGLKWEVSLSNRLFPEFYWLDYHAGEGSYRGGRTLAGVPVTPDDTTVTNDGVVMKEWRTGGNPKPSFTNVAHALHTKIGNIRYSAYFDDDLYRSVIHRVMFDELSAPFGQWGFGFVAAEGAAHTLIRLDLLPARVGFGNPVQDNHFRFFFLRIDLAYRDLQTFHVGVTTSMLLDSRIFRPGDKR